LLRRTQSSARPDECVRAYVKGAQCEQFYALTLNPLLEVLDELELSRLRMSS